MNTRVLMTASAIVLGSTGIALSFLPQEAAVLWGLPAETALLFQLLGAAYFGFAMLNWMAKANLIGGIYSLPVALGNFAHFLIGSLTLLKLCMNNATTVPVYLWLNALAYGLFALLFGYVLFTSPRKVVSL